MKTPEFIFPDEPEYSQKCIYCGGNDLIREVTVFDQSEMGEHAVKVGKDRNPGALVFKGRERSFTQAMVCGTCGFVHMFATSPAMLKMA